MRLLTASLAIVLATSGAFGVEDGDRTAFREAIDRQIAAFRRDDAEGAWNLASPGIHGLFGTPETFLGMVRQGYPPVYRPKSYVFGDAKDVEVGAEQSVRIDDAEGVGWTAIYSFERQPDGHWSISGCRLIKAPDQSV